MIELTDAAKKELETYFEGKDKSTIRIFLAPGGCAGPRLILVLDEANESDSTVESSGFTFCINKDLLDKIKGAKIDLTPNGFSVQPEVPLPETGASACGGCCGGCGSK